MTYKTLYLHRMVAEQTSIVSSDGREVVHHLDEDKSNNSPENLVVVCSSPSVHRQYHARSLRQRLEAVACGRVAHRPLIKVGDLWL